MRSALIDWIVDCDAADLASSAVLARVLICLISSFDILVSSPRSLVIASSHRVGVLVIAQFPVRSGPYRDQVCDARPPGHPSATRRNSYFLSTALPTCSEERERERERERDKLGDCVGC